MKKKIYGWHFCNKTLRDGSPIPTDGEWLNFNGPVQMCVSGLHFSDTPAQALQYAPGATLCYVELENIVKRDTDKGVCSRRKIIARMDATEALRYFARMQALSVSHLWAENDDPNDVVLDYLLTGDDAARAAAMDAAWTTAWTASWDAAWTAAWTAARDAAWDAAWTAARDAAWTAARDDARDDAMDDFNQLIYECFQDVMP